MFTCGPALIAGAKTTLTKYLTSLSPVALFPMGDSVGSTFLNDTIGGIHATLGGTYTLGSTSLVVNDPTKSVFWNSASAQGATPAASLWALGTGDFSAHIVMKWTSTTFGTSFTVRDSSSNILFLVSINRVSSTDVCVECWNFSSSKVSAGTGFNDGNPHSIYIFYTASSQTLGIYVDGVLKNSAVQSGTRPTVSTMMGIIGGNVGGIQGQPCNQGFAVFFNKNLTTGQITTISNLVKLGHV